MKFARLALVSAFGVSWKCGVVVLAVAALSALAPGDGDHAQSDASGSDSIRTIAITGGESVQVVMSAPAGKGASKCMLVDEQGRQLLQVTYDKFGALEIRWGDAYPVRTRCVAVRGGWFYVDADENENRYQMIIDPEGVSGVMARDVSTGECHGLGYTQDGDLVVDPWAYKLTPWDTTSHVTPADPSARSTPAGSGSSAGKLGSL